MGDEQGSKEKSSPSGRWTWCREGKMDATLVERETRYILSSTVVSVSSGMGTEGCIRLSLSTVKVDQMPHLIAIRPLLPGDVFGRL